MLRSVSSAPRKGQSLHSPLDRLGASLGCRMPHRARIREMRAGCTLPLLLRNDLGLLVRGELGVKGGRILLVALRRTPPSVAQRAVKQRHQLFISEGRDVSSLQSLLPPRGSDVRRGRSAGGRGLVAGQKLTTSKTRGESPKASFWNQVCENSDFRFCVAPLRTSSSACSTRRKSFQQMASKRSRWGIKLSSWSGLRSTNVMTTIDTSPSRGSSTAGDECTSEANRRSKKRRAASCSSSRGPLLRRGSRIASGAAMLVRRTHETS